MRISIEDNSIPNSALLDGYNSGGSVSSSGGTSIDSSIITLKAGMNIAKNQLVGIDNGMGVGSIGLAVLADYGGIPCVGIALDTVTENNVLRIKIQGIYDIFNNTANEYYLGATGNTRPYAYESNKLLQKVADKISDNQIFINIEKSILML